MINTVSCQWFSQKCAPKCINRLSLAISLKFSQCAILATTLAAKAWAHRNVAVGTSLKISPHKKPPPPPPHTHTWRKWLPKRKTRRKEVLHMEKKAPIVL